MTCGLMDMGAASVVSAAATSDHATFAAAVAQAQSDATAGKTYRVVAAGIPGADYRYSANLDYLVPSEWYINDADLTLLDDGAGNDCTWDESDNVAALTARGWTESVGGTGDASDDAGSVLIDGGDSFAQMYFDFDSLTTQRVGYILRCKPTAGTATGKVYFGFRSTNGGTVRAAITLSAGGTPGKVQTFQGGSTTLVGEGDFTISTSAFTTLFCVFDVTAATRITRCWPEDGDSGEETAAARASFATISAKRCIVACQSGGTVYVDRFQAVELAS